MLDPVTWFVIGMFIGSCIGSAVAAIMLYKPEPKIDELIGRMRWNDLKTCAELRKKFPDKHDSFCPHCRKWEPSHEL